MAKDSAHEFSDAEIRAFEREVEGVYGEAGKTACANLKRYLAQFEADDEKMRGRLEAGEITKAQYRSWRSGKIAAGRRYRIVLKQCAEAMTHANVVAAAAIEGRLPEVYAENYNYGTWQVESAVGVDTAFALQDASTVQRLLTDHDSYLPKPSVNVAKDMAWNRRLIANQITQGVLLGESIPKIAKRMQDVTGANRAAAVRLARTSTTAAENAGRVDSYKRAKGLGIKVQQEWLATMDGRTRSSHRQLDGEKVEVGEKFSNGCRYPGDPEAPYAETCNCRCTLIAAVDGVDYSDGKRWSRLPEGMTYEEWKAGKPAVTGAKPADRTIFEFMGMPGTARKLDAAGVSPTEARKRLTEQLEDYGIPSSGFRKMSAGDQQKVLDTALATERGITSKRHSARGSKVNMDLVKSDGYAAKFSKLDMPRDAAASVRKSAVAMLSHRSGSDLEDLVLVSKSEGRVVARSTAGTVPFETARNAEVDRAISTHPRGDLVSVHNHPTDLPPTGSDFVSAGYKGYGGGVVALHNGEVFYYEVGDIPFRVESFDNKVENKVKMGTSRYDAIIEVMREFERSHGIKWEKL